MRKGGFTLIEIVLYTAIFAVVAGLLTGILLTVTQVQQRESASAEVTGQLNFVMQTVQRLVKGSSNIEIPVGVSTSTLKLRMEDQTKDPTCLSLVNGVIKLAQGPSATDPNECTNITSDLTNSRVIVDTFNFKKFVQYPGHDTLSIDMQMTYNTINPKSQVQRTLSSAIARVSAATFDSDVVPGGTYNYNIGQVGAPWQNLYLSGVLNLGTAASDPVGRNGSIYYNTASSTFRGYASGTWSNLGGGWGTSGNNIYNTNSGNVGIGTAAPPDLLTIQNTGFGGGPHGLMTLVGGTESSIMLQGTGVGPDQTKIYLDATNNKFYIRHGAGARITIDSSGKVGIGTTSPAYTLDVNGPIVGRFGAGDILLVNVPDTATTTSYSSYTKVKEVQLGQGGSLRIKFDLMCGSGCSSKLETCATAYGRIYKNGTAVGTERNTTNSSWTTFSEDITGFLPGDLVQLYVKGASSGTGYLACNRNFNLYSTPYPGASITQQ